MKWYPRACPVCGGDLHEDVQSRGGWVTCLMCGREFQLGGKPKTERPPINWDDEAA